MTASPISATIAKIAAEDAVIDMAAAAMRHARHTGMLTRDPIGALFDDRIRRQARRLLISAVLHLYPLDALFPRLMLGGMSRYDMAGADDEALVEILDGLEDAAREEARECRERMGAGA